MALISANGFITNLWYREEVYEISVFVIDKELKRRRKEQSTEDLTEVKDHEICIYQSFGLFGLNEQVEWTDWTNGLFTYIKTYRAFKREG